MVLLKYKISKSQLDRADGRKVISQNRGDDNLEGINSKLYDSSEPQSSKVTIVNKGV